MLWPLDAIDPRRLWAMAASRPEALAQGDSTTEMRAWSELGNRSLSARTTGRTQVEISPGPFDRIKMSLGGKDAMSKETTGASW
jgi:hypothetical protein